MRHRQRAHHCGRAGFDAQLVVDVLQVLVHSARADAEDGANVLVGLAGGQPVQYVPFARCQRQR